MACDQSKWQFAEGDFSSPDVQALLALHFDAMRATSPPEACHVLPLDALLSEDITFWALREDCRLLSIGALKRLDAGHGEIKSMRTDPASTGRGAGRMMLDHIIAESRRRGYTRLSLETGSTAEFHAAIRLYERNGFVPSGPFADYRPTPFTRFYSRSL